jgi:hypothetical protein
MELSLRTQCLKEDSILFAPIRPSLRNKFSNADSRHQTESDDADDHQDD